MASANKAVIVTGAASGIGLAMTMGLITAGHDVTAVDRNAAGLMELGKQAARLNGGSVQTVTADLAIPDSFAHVTGAALIKYGRIDALVNNAGIGQASRCPELGPPCCFAFAFGCGELLFRCFAFERSVGPLSNAQIPRAEATIQVEFSSIVLAPGGPSTLEPPARGERLGGRSVRPGGSCSSPPR